MGSFGFMGHFGVGVIEGWHEKFGGSTFWRLKLRGVSLKLVGLRVPKPLVT